ncbi:MAG: cupredoxin domain-containing protein [Stellaceae bacterium]
MAIRLTLRKGDWVATALALSVFLLVVVPAVIIYKPHYTKSHYVLNAIAGNSPVVTVSQRGRTFHPDTLTITRGTVLHIVNDDTVTHHIYVKSPVMNFDSGEQSQGTSVNMEFDYPGTFQVLCAIHPTMHLMVTVK